MHSYPGEHFEVTEHTLKTHVSMRPLWLPEVGVLRRIDAGVHGAGLLHSTFHYVS